MEPFQNRQLRDLFNEINDRISELADQYSNDEIMGNDLSILADRIYDEVKLEPLMIDRKNITRQNPQFKKSGNISRPCIGGLGTPTRAW